MRLFCVIPAVFLSSAWGQPVPLEGENSAGFIARWNAWVANVNPDQAAFPEIVRLVNEIDAALEEVDSRRYVEWYMQDSLPGSPEWPLVERAAERIRPLTDELRVVLERPYLAMPLGKPVAEGDPGPQESNANWTAAQCLLFPALTEGERATGRALMFLGYEATVAKRRGDLGTQVAYRLAAFNLARLDSEYPAAFWSLRAKAAGGQAVQSVLDLVERSGARLRESSLERMQTSLLGWLESSQISQKYARLELMAGEEWIAEWFRVDDPTRLSEVGESWIQPLHRMHEGMYPDFVAMGFGFGIIPKPDLNGEFAPADEQARVFRTIFEAVYRDGEASWHSMRSLETSRLHAMIQANDPDGRLTPALLALWSQQPWAKWAVRDRTETRAACVVLAVYRHHAATGQWPAALSDIKPEHMRIQPLDPYSGKPFGYTVIDGQPLVWSLGVDQDDDAGRRGGWDGYAPPWMPRDDYDALPEEARAQMDGDWLIFPEAPLSPASSDVQP